MTDREYYPDPDPDESSDAESEAAFMPVFETRTKVRLMVQGATGLRDSPRLEAATDIVRRMFASGGFVRGWALNMLSGKYGDKCIDRAIDSLIGANVIEVDDTQARTQGGGRVFKIRDATEWGEGGDGW